MKDGYRRYALAAKLAAAPPPMVRLSKRTVMTSGRIQLIEVIGVGHGHLSRSRQILLITEGNSGRTITKGISLLISMEATSMMLPADKISSLRTRGWAASGPHRNSRHWKFRKPLMGTQRLQLRLRSIVGRWCLDRKYRFTSLLVPNTFCARRL